LSRLCWCLTRHVAAATLVSMPTIGIGVRCFLLAIGAALVGLVIGTLIKQPSTEATVVVFAIGVLLIVLGLLRRPRRGTA